MVSNEKSALVIGKSGQLAQELMRTKPEGWSVTALGRREVDFSNRDAATAIIAEVKPDVIINTAAYTEVDKAEADVERAYAVNCVLVGHVAAAAKEIGAALVHVSTDFVFDGQKSTPYAQHDSPSPLSVYGKSKLAGEQLLKEFGVANSIIVRTSWLYSSHGSNFVKKMLVLMQERAELGVVYDQVGSPTWAYGLALALWRSAEVLSVEGAGRSTGVYSWTDAGIASWYDFAVAIQDIAIQQGLLNRKIPISPVTHHEYPTPAKRPSYSVLDKSEFESVFEYKTTHWRSQLESMISDLANSAERQVTQLR